MYDHSVSLRIREVVLSVVGKLRFSAERIWPQVKPVVTMSPTEKSPISVCLSLPTTDHPEHDPIHINIDVHKYGDGVVCIETDVSHELSGVIYYFDRSFEPIERMDTNTLDWLITPAIQSINHVLQRS